MKTKFQERVWELVDVDAPNLWNTFKNSMLQACDEVCGKKNGRRNHGDTWWWNEEVKKAIQQKKVAYEKRYKNRLEENKAKYKNIKNRTKKVVANLLMLPIYGILLKIVCWKLVMKYVERKR